MSGLTAQQALDLLAGTIKGVSIAFDFDPSRRPRIKSADVQHTLLQYAD